MKNSCVLTSWLVCVGLVSACSLASAAEVGSPDAEAVSPGSIISIRLDRTVPAGAKPPQILIGNKVVPVQSVQGSNANVLVPNLPPGTATVHIRETNGTQVTLAPITVAPTVSKQLILSFTNNSIVFLRATPSGDRFFADVEPSQTRLSYDVFNQAGALVTSGAILHPTKGRMEVFGEPQPGQISAHTAHHADAIFSIKVPNIPAGGKVRFYEAAPGINLMTAQGRAQRQFINTITF